MDNPDQEERSEFSILRYLRSAIQRTSRHTRLVLDRLSRLFSHLNCMKVNVEDCGRNYSRKLTKREKAFLFREVERMLDSKSVKDRDSKSSSYDSLADETLSIRASTLTSPATSIGYSAGSGTATDSSSISTYDNEYSIKTFSYRDSCSPPACYQLFTTPVRSTSITSLERLPEQEISKSLPAVINPEISDVFSLPGSPISYYRSSADLNVEEINSLDDGFWDAAPPKY